MIDSMVSHVEAVIILGDEVDPAAAVKYSAAVYGTSFPRRKITLEPKNFDDHSMWYSHETQFEYRVTSRRLSDTAPDDRDRNITE